MGTCDRRTPSFFFASWALFASFAFAKARLNFLAALASGFLCSEAPCVWFRGLRRLPAALVFRLHTFRSQHEQTA
jgi:hypothetical protein